MRFVHSGADEVHDLLSVAREEFCDQSPMAALPGCFRAHQARLRPGESLVQGFLPRGCPHTGRVARELTEAREELLAGLPAAQPTELDGMEVRDAYVLERRSEPSLVELGVSPRGGKATHVDERLDSGLAQALDQLVRGPPAVADRVDYWRHTHRIAAPTGKESMWPRR